MCVGVCMDGRECVWGYVWMGVYVCGGYVWMGVNVSV